MPRPRAQQRPKLMKLTTVIFAVASFTLIFNRIHVLSAKFIGSNRAFNYVVAVYNTSLCVSALITIHMVSTLSFMHLGFTFAQRFGYFQRVQRREFVNSRFFRITTRLLGILWTIIFIYWVGSSLLGSTSNPKNKKAKLDFVEFMINADKELVPVSFSKPLVQILGLINIAIFISTGLVA